MIRRLIEFCKSNGKKKYHFIHIPKNGGNSVRKILKTRGDVVLSEPFHHRYVDVAPESGDELKYFCIVRNPWARTASRFMFGKQNALKWPENDPRRIYILNASFSDFVQDQKIFEIPRHPGKPWMGPLSSWFNQLEWIKDKSGEVKCDCLRLECIDHDLSVYFNSPIVAPNQNKTKVDYDYRVLYTDELVEKVAEIFSEDIEYFGFTFKGAATRHIYGLHRRRPIIH